jgi:hypothetical protein
MRSSHDVSSHDPMFDRQVPAGGRWPIGCGFWCVVGGL